MSDALLTLDNCFIAFGGLVAVDSVNIALKPGELIGLIGPNGAGKTTVFNLITGVYRPTMGGIYLGGRPIHGHKPHEIAAVGIARTFQNIRLFGSLTALDNVRVGAHTHVRYSPGDAIWRTRAFAVQDHEQTTRAIHLLHVLGLGGFQNTDARSLPYGEQRRLEIARALASEPKVLLLDEPTAGMNPHETRELMEVIKSIRDDFGLTILLIEHDMKVVMGICERIYVLDYGKVIAEGKPEEIRNNPAVIEAYLGEA
ncbi:MAG: ABC transporter ATP-binding protein [Armatimonadota bacterium]|nr:ABC transporter ATP-binding protein [Armatimonadota bacterium]